MINSLVLVYLHPKRTPTFFSLVKRAALFPCITPYCPLFFSYQYALPFSCFPIYFHLFFLCFRFFFEGMPSIRIERTAPFGSFFFAEFPPLSIYDQYFFKLSFFLVFRSLLVALCFFVPEPPRFFCHSSKSHIDFFFPSPL